jgi:dihydropteroate synthase
MNQKSLSPRIMGILNVTPDSFSDGGLFYSSEQSIAQAEKMIADGADILDIGGESTRPYAEPVALEEEIERTIPVIKAIRTRFDIPISIDTTKAEVARQALDAGADIINDISAMQKEQNIVEVAVNHNCPVIIMHMQGTPADMQDRPSYDDVLDEITSFFVERLQHLTSLGIAEDKITIDPGIGFGKTLEHNLRIIKHLDHFKTLGRPLLLAHSRKSFLGLLTGLEDPLDRDLPTAIVSAFASSYHNVDMLRVHDVAATRAALKIAQALV